MKRIIIVVAVITSLNCFAQKNNSGLMLNKGQKITVVMNSTMDVDMGMQLKNVSSATSTLNVIAEDNSSYTITNTLNKLKVSIDAGGQQNAYDSEKEEDKNSDMGKAISKKLNVADTVAVNRSSANIVSKAIKPDASSADASNPLESLMQAMGGSSQDVTVVENAFFIVPGGKKAGDTWTDSSTEKNMKTVKNYLLKSFDKNIATINLTGTVSGNTQADLQGMQADIAINTKTTGDILVDTKTGLVTRRTLNADISGTIDFMGQSMPMSSKTVSTFEYQP